jgi:hypothetical protein
MPTILRRAILLVGTTSALLSTTRRGFAQSAAPVTGGPSFPRVLPPLPYAFSANEPSVDALGTRQQSMTIFIQRF